MADYARGTWRNKKKELEFALDGSFSAHQRWLLHEELGHLSALEKQVERVEREIEQRMKPHAEQLRRLDTIPGIDQITAWTLRAELGTDMSVFPDADHCASWAGMCPGNRRSAGKQLSGRTRKANPYIRRDLCQAAWAASHSKGTYLSALYKRYRATLGHHKAIFAVAHQMLLTAYTMLKRGEDYHELGGDYFDKQNKPRLAQRLVKRLANLGYAVKLTEAAELAPVAPAHQTGNEAQNQAAPTADPGLVAPRPGVAEAAKAADSSPDAPVRPKRGRPCKCALRGLPCRHNNSRNVQILNNSSA
jgi:hypothetical protein